MSAVSIKVAPIREWPGMLTSSRKSSPFMAHYSQTEVLLDHELRQLGVKEATLLMALLPGDIRLDGRPRSNSRPSHPGVILEFDTKLGHLSYPCDRFHSWQDNLRAIALGLEALRRVDRYGITAHGEQYRGFLALEAGTAMPAGFQWPADALKFLRTIVGTYDERTTNVELVRRAKRIAHPDTGGDADTFQRVSLAEAMLRAAGEL